MFYVVQLFMKNVFVQLWQLLLKYRKRLIYWVFAFLVGQFCFFGLGWIWIENEVFAATENPNQSQTFEDKAKDWNKELSFVKKAVYILVYPVLIVAGKLVDNSLVYGEVFWFDAVLWKLWNIVRNLANFGLWFIFVFYVFKFLTSWQKPKDFKDLLVKALIAWVWIQASWFIIAVLIDISTILAYGIWWLPMSILPTDGQDTEKYNPYVLKTIVDVDVNDIDSMKIYYATVKLHDDNGGESDTKYIAPCETIEYKGEELILAPSIIYYGSWTDAKPTLEKACNLDGDIYYFSSLYEKIHWVNCNGSECAAQQIQSYAVDLSNAATEIWWKPEQDVIGLIEQGILLQIRDAHSTWYTSSKLWTGVYSDPNLWLDVDNKQTGTTYSLSRLSDVATGSSYVWTFSVLYSSLMNAGWHVIPQTNTYSSLLSVILSFWHMLAIFIPLLAAVVVFMMRIGVIWVAIAISPFIVLLTAFGLGKDIFKDGFMEYLKPENLIVIIFTPAIICFAVSLSTVLVVIISSIDVGAIQGLSGEILGWLIQIDISGFAIGFWELVKVVLWVALTWFIMWAAIETSKLWKSETIKSLKNLTKSAIWSIPIVPMPKRDWTIDFIWANSAFGLNGQESILSAATSQIKRKFTWESGKAVDARLNPKKAEKDAGGKRAETYGSKLIEQIGTIKGTDWRNQSITIWEDNQTSMTFGNLNDSEKESLIKEINGITDKDKRMAFGENVKEIKIWEKTYTFVEQDEKWNDKYQYVEQKSEQGK